MPKKLKLNLNDLKVQSFVTALDNDERAKLMGGTGDDCATPSNCGPTQCTCASCGVSCTTGCTGGELCCWE